MNLTPQVVWQIFIATGCVSAYLLYRQLIELPPNSVN